MNEVLECIPEFTFQKMEKEINEFLRENEDCILRIDVMDGSAKTLFESNHLTEIVRKKVKEIRLANNTLFVNEEYLGGAFVIFLENAAKYQITVGNKRNRKSYIVEDKGGLAGSEIYKTFSPSDLNVYRIFGSISRAVKEDGGPCLLKVIYFLGDGETKEVSDTLTVSLLPTEVHTNVFKTVNEIDLNIPSGCCAVILLSSIADQEAKILKSFTMERIADSYYLV